MVGWANFLHSHQKNTFAKCPGFFPLANLISDKSIHEKLELGVEGNLKFSLKGFILWKHYSLRPTEVNNKNAPVRDEGRAGGGGRRGDVAIVVAVSARLKRVRSEESLWTVSFIEKKVDFSYFCQSLSVFYQVTRKAQLNCNCQIVNKPFITQGKTDVVENSR
jgi:hypothetical protein